MFRIGDRVRVKPPFDAALPDIYTIESNDRDVFQIHGGTDFAEEHLEAVTD